MEKELKELLSKLKEQQDNRNNEINNIQKNIERVELRKENSLERFENEIQSDIAAGIYMNTTEGKLQKMIDEEKNKIIEEAEKEKGQLVKKLEETQKQDEIDRTNEYNQIRESISDYHFKMGMEIIKAERQLKDMQAERDEKIANIDKLISDKEAKYNHLIIKNRNFMDIEITQASAEINELRSELEELKAEKEEINNKVNIKIAEQEKYIQDCNEKHKRASKFTTEIRLSTKSIEEIHEILFGKEVKEVEMKTKQESENEQLKTEEQKAEEQKVEEQKVEEQKAEESKAEESKAEEQKAEEQKAEESKAEEQKAEESKAEESKAEESKVKKQKAEETRIEEEIGKINQKIRAVKDLFMEVTGINEEEMKEIYDNDQQWNEIFVLYSDYEDVLKYGNKTDERYIEAIDKIKEYYMNIERKLDIEVFAKGIKIDKEKVGAGKISTYENEYKNKEYIDSLISKHIGNDDIKYDRNIIISIVSDSYRESEDGKRELTPCAEKKLRTYLNMLKEPSNENKEKCSVTYDLTKMSKLMRIFTMNEKWTDADVKSFKEIAYEAKDIYADVKTGPITKARWAIKDMFKRISTPKMSSGEKEKEEQQSKDDNEKLLDEMVRGREQRAEERYNEQIKEALEEQTANEEKANSWNLTPEQKAYANDMSDIQGKLVEQLDNIMGVEKLTGDVLDANGNTIVSKEDSSR